MGKRLIDPNKICLGCMRELNTEDSRCPYCGFDISKYQRPENSLPLREILNGKYLIGRVIGCGGFGITYIGWDLYQCKKVCIKEYFPRTVAVRNNSAQTYSEQISVSIRYSQDRTQANSQAKIMYAYAEGLKNYIKEAESLSRFYFMPGIVSVRDFFYGNHTAYIVMEYLEGIDMKKYAKRKGGRLMPEEVFPILKDVLKALNEVHKVNIIHRDISPDNIMLTKDMTAKLIDFGAARYYDNGNGAPVLFKKGYAPIEQYTRDGKQGPWTDIYSMCASIYYLLTGKVIPEARKRMEKDTVQLLQVMGVPVSEKCDLAIHRGLQLDPRERYQSIAELYQDIYGETI